LYGLIFEKTLNLIYQKLQNEDIIFIVLEIESKCNLQAFSLMVSEADLAAALAPSTPSLTASTTLS
jgi:hypothetical protein